MKGLSYTLVIPAPVPRPFLLMSFFSKFEDYTVSPLKIGINLAEDLIQTRDVPSWHQILDSFHKKDEPTTLPALQLTDYNGSGGNGGALAERIMDQGPDTKANRVSDIDW